MDDIDFREVTFSKYFTRNNVSIHSEKTELIKARYGQLFLYVNEARFINAHQRLFNLGTFVRVRYGQTNYETEIIQNVLMNPQWMQCLKISLKYNNEGLFPDTIEIAVYCVQQREKICIGKSVLSLKELLMDKSDLNNWFALVDDKQISGSIHLGFNFQKLGDALSKKNTTTGTSVHSQDAFYSNQNNSYYLEENKGYSESNSSYSSRSQLNTHFNISLLNLDKLVNSSENNQFEALVDIKNQIQEQQDALQKMANNQQPHQDQKQKGQFSSGYAIQQFFNTKTKHSNSNIVNSEYFNQSYKVNNNSQLKLSLQKIQALDDMISQIAKYKENNAYIESNQFNLLANVKQINSEIQLKQQEIISKKTVADQMQISKCYPLKKRQHIILEKFNKKKQKDQQIVSIMKEQLNLFEKNQIQSHIKQTLLNYNLDTISNPFQ